MGRMTAEVRALPQERQDQRRAELDARRRDVQFAVRDEGLPVTRLNTEHASDATPLRVAVGGLRALAPSRPLRALRRTSPRRPGPAAAIPSRWRPSAPAQLRC